MLNISKENDMKNVSVEDVKVMTAVVVKAKEVERNLELAKLEVKAEAIRYDAIMARIRSGK